MISLKKQSNAFTIVELLIVIVVIGVLALLVISTYSGIQSNKRNNTRQTDIKLVQAALESFYAQNGYYPSLHDMNSAKWRATNMKSFDANLIVDPSSKCNPSQTGCLVAKPKAKAYAYAVSDSSGAACETDDTDCAQYTLTATFEGSVDGSTTFDKSNLDGTNP